ncbi:hypothetical protein EIP86_002625 [Pleurotus ostreatoroseus]|nr:hypothetical protein EIP86_002625 [Pleurotus ostreatoroseus]
MSRTHNIDSGDESFLDTFEPLEPSSLLEESARGLSLAPPHIYHSQRDSTLPLYAHDGPSSHAATATMNSVDPKGKAVSYGASTSSEPMSIPLAGNVRPDVDLFSLSLDSDAGSSSSRSFARTPSYGEMPTAHGGVFRDADGAADLPSDERAAPAVGGKGKGRELPPTLPPLDFSSADFSYGSAEWSSTAGPSSYGSGHTSFGGTDGSPGAPSPLAQRSASASAASSAPSTPHTVPSPHPVMSRRRTVSSDSKHSRHSISAPLLPKVKVKFPASSKAASGTLARKLLFKKSPPTSPQSASVDLGAGSSTSNVVAPDLSDLGYVNQGNCLIPWSKDMRSRSPLATPVVETNSVLGIVDSRTPRLVNPVPLRTKGRSYSSPFPLQTVFDIVPLEPTDLFAPIPVVRPDYLDTYLPHEIKLQIFRTLLDLFVAEHEKRVHSEKWTANKAGSHKHKWVGLDRGIRELFRLSRVSKSWQHLVFDGQLWSKMDLRSFPKVPPSVLMRLAETAGGFVRSLDFTGHTDLCGDVLMDVTFHISAQQSLTDGMKHTSLTSLNLQGCPALTTRALHYVLIRSPCLERLCLKSQSSVIDTTCDVLAAYCPRLVYLDLSRCPNLTGGGIKSVATKAVARGEHMLLKELRLSGLRRVSDVMMEALGKAAPLLEVLDLSYCRELHNSAIEAFVSCSQRDSERFETVCLTSREAGRDPAHNSRHWRRVTRLRHLNLSFCVLLTDHACSHLAYAVPKLEFLELAGIGSELRDDGLVRLLTTTPYIRKIDLEDATEVTDAVLEVLTPPTPAAPSPPGTPPISPEPIPGHALEHLIVSYANVDSEALGELVRACPRLRVLEADNTRMTGLVLRAFVQRARERHTRDARIVAVDCRCVGEHAVREVAPLTRPRRGWRAWQARKLAYLDGRDGEELGVGQDECDESRVVVKTFYSWQTVDQVKAAREKKRKASASKRGVNASGSSHVSEDPAASVSSSVRSRWWQPSGRRSTPVTPTFDMENRGEGCTIM